MASSRWEGNWNLCGSALSKEEKVINSVACSNELGKIDFIQLLVSVCKLLPCSFNKISLWVLELRDSAFPLKEVTSISMKCKLIFFLNGLQGILDEFACISKAIVTNLWKPDVTHVIASVDEQGGCSRTLKVLMAILTGKWILSIECEYFYSCKPCDILNSLLL